MARGFESKDVESQQAEADRGKAAATTRPTLTSGQRDARDKRRAVELSLARAQADLGAARTAGHRDMLKAAIAALEDELQRIA